MRHEPVIVPVSYKPPPYQGYLQHTPESERLAAHHRVLRRQFWNCLCDLVRSGAVRRGLVVAAVGDAMSAESEEGDSPNQCRYPHARND